MSPSILPVAPFLTHYPLHRLIVEGEEEEEEECYEPRPEWAKATRKCVYEVGGGKGGSVLYIRKRLV